MHTSLLTKKPVVFARSCSPAASALTTLPPARWTHVSFAAHFILPFRHYRKIKLKLTHCGNTAFFYPQESPEAVAFHKSNGLEGRLTDVKDIAPIVKFLCTEGQWITGQTLFANGGYTTR